MFESLKISCLSPVFGLGILFQGVKGFDAIDDHVTGAFAYYSMVFDQIALERKPSLSSSASPVITHTVRISVKQIAGPKINQSVITRYSTGVPSICPSSGITGETPKPK